MPAVIDQMKVTQLMSRFPRGIPVYRGSRLNDCLTYASGELSLTVKMNVDSGQLRPACAMEVGDYPERVPAGCLRRFSPTMINLQSLLDAFQI